MKNVKNNKYFTSAECEMSSGEKKHVHSLLMCAVLLIILPALLCGSVLSFAKSIYSPENKQHSEDLLNIVQLDAEVLEENGKKLEEFDNNIKEKEALIRDIEKQISEKAQTPEEKLCVEELYDRQIKALFDLHEMCREYSETCTQWSEDTRTLLADPISEYEKYLALYKERLALSYEVGTPDKSEIFSTSNTIIDFIAGKAMLDELKAYEEELRIKAEELYAVVADGLETVKYYITKASSYSGKSLAAYDELKNISQKASGYLDSINSDKDVYNYYLLLAEESQQRLAKEIAESIDKYSDAFTGKTEKLEWPLSSDFFYTDYIGSGHESRYEWSAVLSKYVNITHSGMDIYTAGTHAEVLAAAKGMVIYADYIPLKGYTVAVLHAGNIVTVYSHCATLKVELGSMVEAGDVIALSGVSGDADTEKITFEVFAKGDFVDPAGFIELPDVSLSEN